MSASAGGGAVRGAWSVVGGACFVASSWTWCIGMWLPVFLVGDFGWPAWVVFVIPNALGAMSVGVLLRRPGASAAMVARHRAALRAFSLLTVLFQVSFLSWWLAGLASRTPYVRQGFVGAGLAWVVVGLAVWLAGRRRDWWAWGAAAAFGVSLLSWWMTVRAGGRLEWPPLEGARGARDLVFAAPVIVFGFALCPFLDLTFHRARQERPGVAGTWAFVLGFGVFFPVLMVYSALYAGAWVRGTMNSWLAAHIGAQVAFTIAAHVREIASGWSGRTGVARAGRAIGFIAVLGLAACSAGLPWLPDYRPGFPATRLVYEVFMGAYALVFPAYVWIVVIERGGSMRRRVVVWGAAVVVAAPLLWVGYIEQRYAWLPGAVGIPLFAALAARGGRRAAAAGF